MKTEINACIGNNHQLPTSGSPSTRARLFMESLPGEPFWLCEWREVVFMHFEVDPLVLQQSVPFSLELFSGRAFVSLVAFTLAGMRPRFGGGLTRALFKPFGTHHFLNVRTYVQHRGRSGIYFLAEWLDAPRLNRLCGPLIYGLPFRCGLLDYWNAGENNQVRGYIAEKTARLEYSGRIGNSPQTGEQGSLQEFLVQRYLAFIRRQGHAAWFPVWHKPWKIAPLKVELENDALLETSGNWFITATLHCAHWSAGSGETWMGWRRPCSGNRLTDLSFCPVNESPTSKMVR